MTHRLLRWPVVIIAGVFVTLSTVVISNSMGGFGFPLPWKTGGCPPPGIVITSSCLIAIGFDWIRFAVDALFYTVIGYAVLLGIARYHMRRVPSFRHR